MKKRCHLCSTRTRQASQVFPNTDNHLLSGSTGSIVISNEMKQVIVIPQSATYEIQDKTYAWRIVDGRSTSGRLLPTGRKKADSKIITVLPTSDGKNYVVTSGPRCPLSSCHCQQRHPRRFSWSTYRRNDREKAQDAGRGKIGLIVNLHFFVHSACSFLIIPLF